MRKPGKSGEHAFSSTDAQFERDVAKYQARQRRQMIRLGVCGWPVAHSRSPQMHNAALKVLGPGRLALPAPAAAAAPVHGDRQALPRLGFSGVNVTIPHKEQALALADHATETAQGDRRREHADLRRPTARSTPRTPTRPASSPR